MKKYIILLLAFTLLLTGCAVQREPDTTTTVSTEPTQPPGLYVPDSAPEKETAGAVRLYALGGGGYRQLTAMGDQLLLISEGETATLTVLTGADCIPTVEISMDGDLLSGSYRALYNGFAYYDEAENQAIFLDPQLHEVNRITLPEDIQGQPVFSPDGNEIFYCAGQQIRGFEVERKISRLIKTHSYKSLVLQQCYFEGQLLSCLAEDEKDGAKTIYISSQTGETTHSDNNITDIYTYDNTFLALRNDGAVKQRIVGVKGETMQQLHVEESNVFGAPELNGVVAYTAADSGVVMSFYDISSGRKTAAVALSNVGEPKLFYADRWTQSIWMVTADPETSKQQLLQWNIRASAVEGDAIYTDTLYTAAAPDKDGLEACEDRANALNKTYGVRIRLWDDAVKYPGKYTLAMEYQPIAINQVLNDLEPVLAEFPKNFLLKSISSRIRICIVRSVDDAVKSVQYWDQNDAFIVLSAGVDVRTDFLRGLGYVVDSHVLGNSSKFDHWENLNPEGFAYGTPDAALLSGEKRAFADETSMASAVDDRSTIYLQSMLPDNKEMFQSEIMQKKLLTVCQGIRDAWNLEKKTDTYPWEQYLNESIAYVKKK